MTTKEAIYLLRNTAWVAPSLEPVDEAIDMACKSLSKDEPKTEYRIGYYTPTNAEILKTLEDEPRTCFNCKHNVTKHTFDHACGGCIKMDRYEREDKQSGKE